MSSFGIAGLVDGFFKGREIRNGWEDRKDQKARQEKLDKFYADEQGRRAEQHGWLRDSNSRTASDWERAWADKQAERDAWDADRAAEQEELGVVPTPDSVTTSTMGAPPPPGPSSEAAARLPAAVDAATRGSAAADQFQRYFDPSDLGAAPPPVAGGPPAGPRRADVMPDDTRGPAIQEARDNRAMPPRTIEDMRAQAIAEARAMQDMGAAPPQDARSIVPPMNMPDNPRLQMEGPGPGGGGMAPLYDQGILPRRYVGDPSARAEQPAQADPMAGFDREQMSRDMADRLSRDQPNYGHDWGKQGLGPDAREAANRAGAALGAVPRMVGGVVRDAADTATIINNGLNRAVNPVVKYATGGEDGYEFPMAPVRGRAPAAPPASSPSAAPADPAPLGAPPRQQAPASPPAATGPRISNVPAKAPPDVKQLAAVADQTVAQADTPSMQIAAEGVVKMGSELGAAGKRPVTEKQRERAADALITEYMKSGSPRYVAELLRQGKFDDAIKFQEFIETQTFKKGFKHYSRAVFAATNGDFEDFSEELFKAQSVAGYFGDTVKINKSKSGFTKDDQGNIIGAKIVLQDEATGNTYEQVFNSPADFVSAGIQFMAPEVQFEYIKQQTEAARAAALGAVDKAKSEEKDAVKASDDVVKLAQDLMKATNDIANPRGLGPDGKPLPPMTMEEAIDAVLLGREQARAQMAGGPRRAEADPLGAAPPGPPVLRRP